MRTHFIRRANLKPEKAKQKNYKKKVAKNGMAGSARGYCQSCKPLTKTLLIPLQLVHEQHLNMPHGGRLDMPQNLFMDYVKRERHENLLGEGSRRRQATRYPCRAVA